MRLRAADVAGNLAPGVFLDLIIDAAAPRLLNIGGGGSASRSMPVDSVLLTFDEAVTGVTRTALVLTRDGVAVPLGDEVTVEQTAGDAWRVNGLTAATTPAGQYRLSANAALVLDRAGNAGLGNQVVAWTTLPSLPTGISGMVYQDTDVAAASTPRHGTLNPDSLAAHWSR